MIQVDYKLVASLCRSLLSGVDESFAGLSQDLSVSELYLDNTVGLAAEFELEVSEV